MFCCPLRSSSAGHGRAHPRQDRRLEEEGDAFDVHTGRELWQAPLPAGGQATPMTYVAGGRQFVVIAAGGNPRAGTTFGDAVVTFALPAVNAGS